MVEISVDLRVVLVDTVNSFIVVDCVLTLYTDLEPNTDGLDVVVEVVVVEIVVVEVDVVVDVAVVVEVVTVVVVVDVFVVVLVA